MASQRDLDLIALAREKAAAVRSRVDGPPAEAPPRWEALLGSADGLAKYQILRELHRGGQGVVYLARQRGTNRDVAVKVMLRGPFAAERERQRFQREVQTLAAIRHPNIVTVHDSGLATEICYFVMDFVDGRPLDEYVRQIGITADDAPSKPPALRTGGDDELGGADPPRAKIRFSRAHTATVLRLFAKICDAVNAAHLRGVMHRDLKPANILVDDKGEPRILDFGLARTIDERMATSVANVTRTGQFVGTPPWSSPEQVEGLLDALDIRTDVYSLGVMLYHALSGRFPYRVSGRLQEVAQAIINNPPVRLSSVVSGLDADVETIVLKCLNKEPGRRYQSAGELGRDIERWLGGEPIEARRLSTLYVLRKALSRHRAVVGLLAGLLVTVIASGAVLLRLWRVAEGQRAAANRRAEQLRQSEYFNNVALAQVALLDGNVREAKQRLADCPPDLRGWEWNYLVGRTDTSIFEVREHEGYAGALFDTTGEHLITYGFDRLLSFWSFPEGKPVRRLTLPRRINYVATSPVPDRLAVASRDGNGFLINLDSNSVRTLQGHRGRAWGMAWSCDGRLFATASTDGTVCIYDGETGDTLRCFEAHCPWAQAVAFAPDGRLASGGYDNVVRTWDPPSGTLLTERECHRERITSAAFTPDGRYLATSSWDNTIGVWDSVTLEEVRRIRCGTDYPLNLCISSDNRQIAAVVHQVVRRWDIDTGEELPPLRGLEGRILGLGYSPDGKYLAAGSNQGAVKVWRTDDPPQPPTLLAHNSGVQAVDVSPDNGLILSGDADGQICLWSCVTQSLLCELSSSGSRVKSLRFSADGEMVLAVQADGALHRWRVSDFNAASPIRSAAGFSALGVEPDSGLLALGRTDGIIELRDVSDLRLRSMLQSHQSEITDLDFAGATRLASADRSHALVWDLTTGNAIAEMSDFDEVVGDIAISRDGGLLATSGGALAVVYGGEDLRVWDARTGELLHKLQGHRGSTAGVAFSPDGSRLASGCHGQLLNIWEPRSGALILTLRGHHGGVTTMGFAPDGRTLVTGGTDAALRLWETQTAKSDSRLSSHGGGND